MMASGLWKFAPAAGGCYAVVGRKVWAQLSSLAIVDVVKWKAGPRDFVRRAPEIINNHPALQETTKESMNSEPTTTSRHSC